MDSGFPVADCCLRVDFSGGGGGSAFPSAALSSNGFWDSDCDGFVRALGSSAVDPLLMVNVKDRGIDLRLILLETILEGEPSDEFDPFGDSGDVGASISLELAGVL